MLLQGWSRMTGTNLLAANVGTGNIGGSGMSLQAMANPTTARMTS
jgi:hypothetical protein